MNTIDIAGLVKDVFEGQVDIGILNDALKDLNIQPIQPVTVYYIDEDIDEIYFDDIKEKIFASKLQAAAFILKETDDFHASFDKKEIMKLIEDCEDIDEDYDEDEI